MEGHLLDRKTLQIFCIEGKSLATGSNNGEPVDVLDTSIYLETRSQKKKKEAMGARRDEQTHHRPRNRSGQEQERRGAWAGPHERAGHFWAKRVTRRQGRWGNERCQDLCCKYQALALTWRLLAGL